MLIIDRFKEQSITVGDSLDSVIKVIGVRRNGRVTLGIEGPIKVVRTELLSPPIASIPQENTDGNS